MDTLDQKIDQILSNPESMSQIMELAKNLGLSATPSDTQAQPPAKGNESPFLSDTPLATPNPATLLTSLTGINAGDDRQTNLLKALRPYLRPERQDRLDRALQAARMVKTAKLAMKQFMPRGDSSV